MSKKTEKMYGTPQNERIEIAKQWKKEDIDSLELLNRYKKTFKLKKLRAYKELKRAGIKFSNEFERQMINHEKHLLEKKEKKKRAKEENFDDFIESDDCYAYIVGYTSGGAAYGITWDEWEKIEEEERQRELNEGIFDKDLPF